MQGRCTHCGFYHHKASGRLKMYVGAMACREYVKLLLEEMVSWGLKLASAAPAGPTQSARFECEAPVDFTCFHRGTKCASGLPACMSQDGFSSEVDGQAKVTVDPLGNVRENAPLLCPHRLTRRPRRGMEPAPERASTQKGHKHSQMNRMPGGDDPRRAQVYRELDRRIAVLRRLGKSPTPENIAKLGGFIENIRRERKDGA